MRLKFKIIFISAILLGVNLFARTRTQVIEEANNYKNFQWKVGDDNILDTVKRAEKQSDGTWKILEKEVQGQKDGIDDRMEIYDDNGNKKIDDEDWAAMRANWPFKPEDKVTGEAYAWAGWVGNIQWGGDTTNLFSQRLKDSVNKWIAGAREEDCHTTNIQKIIKGGYKGYTGIDCSGFISRLWKPTNTLFKISTESMSNYCVKIPFLDLKPGDILRS